MISLIIWSKDRAAQLDLLLRSLQEFDVQQSFDPIIIYTWSNDEFAEGYKRLQAKNLIPECTWRPQEKSFKEETLSAIDSGCKYVAFACDDNLLYRPLPCSPETAFGGEIGVFSLRLGFNTLVQDCHKGTYQQPLNACSQDEHFVYWSFGMYHPLYNYGYPMALDFHVFRSKYIVPICEEIEFNNTNSLESTLQNYRRKIMPIMASYKQSVTVNWPLNNLSTITHSDERGPLTVLNDRYLNGYILDYEPERIVGCHQELTPVFVEE